jgi:hypothetical protein
VSFRLRTIYRIPFGQLSVPAGIDGGVSPEPIALSVGPWHLAQRTGVPTLFDGPNGTEKGMAFAALQEREASG